MKPISLTNKISIAGVVVAILGVTVPVVSDMLGSKKDDKPHEEKTTSQQTVNADNKSIVIKDNSGNISISSNEKP